MFGERNLDGFAVYAEEIAGLKAARGLKPTLLMYNTKLDGEGGL